MDCTNLVMRAGGVFVLRVIRYAFVHRIVLARIETSTIGFFLVSPVVSAVCMSSKTWSMCLVIMSRYHHLPVFRLDQFGNSLFPIVASVGFGRFLVAVAVRRPEG